MRASLALRDRLTAARRILRTVPAETLEARRRLTTSLRLLADGDFSCSYQILRDERGWRLWIPPATSGIAAAGHAWAAQGSGELFTPAFDPELPPRGQVGRFRSLLEQHRHLRIYRDFYQPFGFERQLRSLFYDGDRFLGWVGVLRSADRPRFSTAEREALDALAPAVQRFLAAVERQEDDGTAAVAPAHLIYAPSGELLHATESVRPWLDQRRRRSLADYAIAFDAGRAPDRQVVDRVEVSCLRLVGRSTAYLMSIRALTPARRSPLAALSPRRRDIARTAAAGATSQEIAESLGISVHTVRQHLKQIYRQLDVVSRVELARRLEP